MLVVATAGLVALSACSRAPEPPSADEPQATVAGSAQGADEARAGAAHAHIPDAATRAKLVGQWLRHDQSYMLVIDAVDEDGRVAARYLNPQPVHVSKAETWIEAGGVRLLLELTDRHYPGNFYELAYRPEEDIWIGVYHHLGVGEDYEVFFVRYREETT